MSGASVIAIFVLGLYTSRPRLRIVKHDLSPLDKDNPINQAAYSR